MDGVTTFDLSQNLVEIICSTKISTYQKVTYLPRVKKDFMSYQAIVVVPLCALKIVWTTMNTFNIDKSTWDIVESSLDCCLPKVYFELGLSYYVQFGPVSSYCRL